MKKAKHAIHNKFSIPDLNVRFTEAKRNINKTHFLFSHAHASTFFSLVPGARTLIFHLDIVIVDILYDQAGLNSDFTGRFFMLRAQLNLGSQGIIHPFSREGGGVLNTCKPEEL